MTMHLNGLSLFTGAGGMDVGFENAGIKVVLANEINKDACSTYLTNHPNTELLQADIHHIADRLDDLRGEIDVVFGGPPCQGFSVAGKMDPLDERNDLIWKFADSVETVKPRAFVMENVKALGKLAKWKNVRDEFIIRMSRNGYNVKKIIVNSSDFGVPQNRERVIFVGMRNDTGTDMFGFENALLRHRKKPPTVREILSNLPKAGTEGNVLTCASKVTLAANPILRRSPYAGMYFNGLGRAINLDGVANTLPASMGGNKTPIIDQECLERPNVRNWSEEYHAGLMDKTISPKFGNAPERLRRLTITEAAALQTFPSDYVFKGSKSSIYTQIGNAVPCLLAEAVAKTVVSFLGRTRGHEYIVPGTLESYATEPIEQ